MRSSCPLKSDSSDHFSSAECSTHALSNSNAYSIERELGFNCPFHKLSRLRNRHCFTIAMCIGSPTRLMIIITYGRMPVELCNTNIPCNLRILMYQMLHSRNAFIDACSSLRHPEEKDSTQARDRLIPPIVVNRTLGQPTQYANGSHQMLWEPSDVL